MLYYAYIAKSMVGFMNHKEIMNRVWAKLGSEKQLQEYCEVIYKITGLVIDFISAEGVSLKLSRGKNFQPLCVFLRNHPDGCKLCQRCDCEQALIAKTQKNYHLYTCHAGFTEIILPLFNKDGTYLGSMTTGQFYLNNSSHSSRTLEKLAVEIKVPGADLKKLAASALVLTGTQVDGLIGYLKLVGDLVSSTNNHLMFMESVNTPDKFTVIQKYIHENYMKPLSIASVAKKFYLSPNYFCKLFHECVGVTFNTYLNCYRIEKCKDMLNDTELSITEIAFYAGFGSISQFNRVFKDVAGKSPREFRRDGK